ncbi:hypothetical protein Tco_0033905 [Tanacetum coccineum]
MLGPGRYSSVHSRFLRYLDTKSNAEKEAIFLILTGIGDEIYSTVDACNTAKEMWTAIERLQQGESLNVQDVKTNLFWEFGKFTSRDGETMESYYSRFYKLMNELTRNNLQVSPMQVNVQFLQQLQPEWSRFVTLSSKEEEIDEQELEAHYSYMAKDSEVSPRNQCSTDTSLNSTNHDENDVFANVRRHSEQPESINDTYVLEKDDSNVILIHQIVY